MSIVGEDLQSRRWFGVGEDVVLCPNRLFASESPIGSLPIEKEGHEGPLAA